MWVFEVLALHWTCAAQKVCMADMFKCFLQKTLGCAEVKPYEQNLKFPLGRARGAGGGSEVAF